MTDVKLPGDPASTDCALPGDPLDMRAEQERNLLLRLANCRALLTRAEDLLRGTPEVNRTRAQKDLLFDIEAMKERC